MIDEHAIGEGASTTPPDRATCTAPTAASSTSTTITPPSACTTRSAASPAARSAAHRSPWTAYIPPPRQPSRHEPQQPPDPELDDLIAELTIDCYDDDEVLMGFENAFDEADCLPCPGAVVGKDVELLSVFAANGRRELIAACQRACRRHHIAFLDIDIHPEQPASRLQAAYRRWLGAEDETS